MISCFSPRIRRLAFLLAATPTAPALAQTAPSSPPVDSEIVVTASRVDLLGKANTASQGTITAKEVELRPVYRASQIFESIPGLVVTIHSGEGKAQQYLIRGYNLDHGTDFASFVDGMPVNRPTNTHGQGYSDLNFIIPQTVAGLDYTKGPYYAAIGDFGAVASAQTRIANEMPAQATVTVGTDGYQQLMTGGTFHLGDDRRLLGAVELTHYDGPWRPAQNFHKANALLRYSQGDAVDGMSVTAMFYKSAGRLITDQPLRATEQGLIDRFGTLDPTDASRSLRYSLSAHLDKPVGPGALAINLYGIHSTMTLWNNFTHYLDDPINGDQEDQNENRTTAGGALAYTITSTFAGIGFETVLGFQGRYDTVFVDRRHTIGRTTILPGCQLAQEDGPTLTYPAVNGYCNADRAHLLDVAPYVQETVRWKPWLNPPFGNASADGRFVLTRRRRLPTTCWQSVDGPAFPIAVISITQWILLQGLLKVCDQAWGKRARLSLGICSPSRRTERNAARPTKDPEAARPAFRRERATAALAYPRMIRS